MRLLRVALGVFGCLVVLVLGYIAVHWAPDRPVSTLVARWAPAPSRFVEVLGASVHVRDVGPRSGALPIVLVHGTSASLHSWDGWAGVLSRDRRVVSLDLPGFGLTGPMPDGLDYSFDSYRRMIMGTLDALAVERFAIAGNSFGGNLAWEVAVAHPDRVAALILIDAAGYTPEPASIPIGFRLARLPVINRLMEVVLPRRVIVSSLRNVSGDPSWITDEVVDRYYELTLREGNRAALLRRFREAPAGIRAHLIRDVRAPTLVMWGGQDRLIPPSHAERFRADIAGSEVVVLPALGHAPHEEDPASTVAAAATFLDRVRTSTPGRSGAP